MDYITYIVLIVLVIFGVIYFKKQFLLSRDIRLEDTTLEELDEKLKKHKLFGGRKKRTKKKTPPIV